MNICYCTIFAITFLEGIYTQGVIESFFFPNFEDDPETKWNSQRDDTETEVSQNYNNDGESVFVSKTSETLPNGNRKITKISQMETTDKAGKIKKKKKVAEYLEFPNGTVVEVSKEYEGKGGSGYSGSGMECVADDDCNRTSYCDRSRFACKACLKQNGTCSRGRECCEGYRCSAEKCQKIIGKADDPCDSDKDCLVQHCCTSGFGENTCQRYRDEGEECGGSDLFYSPKVFHMHRLFNNHKPTRCPCKSGLECREERSFFMFAHHEVCQNKTKKRRANHRRRKRQMMPRTNSFFDVISGMLRGLTSFAEDPEDY